MRLMLAENGFSQMGPPPPPGLGQTPLDKAAKIINSIQAVKSIPFVGEALTIANGLVSLFNAKEKAAFEQTLKEARGEPVKWWAAEGKTGSPWEPMTQEKAAWLADRLGAAVQTESQQMIGLRKGTGAVSKARWVKAYQTLLDQVVADQKKVTAGPGLPNLPGMPAGAGRYLPLILGGAALLFFFFRRKR
jgi:hypothetical protein